MMLERANVNVTGLSAKEKRFIKRAVKRVQKRAKKKVKQSAVIDSRFPGVSIDHTETLWKSQVYMNNTVIFLGRYANEEDAWAMAKNYRKQLGWPSLEPIPLDVWKDLGGNKGSILASELPTNYHHVKIPVQSSSFNRHLSNFEDGDAIDDKMKSWPNPLFRITRAKRKRASALSKHRRSSRHIWKSQRRKSRTKS